MSIKFKRQVRKSGGSNVVALPKEVCEALNIKLNDQLVINVENKKIILEKTN